MTERIRIENADTSNFAVIVEIWGKSGTPGNPDVRVETRKIPYPADEVEIYIHASQYAVVKEQSSV